jgi:ATP-dependent DNA helicase RecG
VQSAPTDAAEGYLGRLERLVGGRTAKALDAELGIRTAEELLGHLPRRYEKRGSMTDLSRLELGDHVTVMARVDRVANRDYVDKRAGGRRGRAVRTEVVVTDGKHELLLTFFRRPWITRELTPGASGLFSGKVQEFRGRLQLLHPDYALHGGLDQDLDGKGLLADTIVPIYPATSKLSSWTISRAIPPVLDAAWHCATALPDPLPAEVAADRGLPSLLQALEQVHRPTTQADWMSGRERFRFEEAFVVQVALAKRRHLTRAQSAAPRPSRAGGLLDRFDARLPFELTAGQRAVAEQLAAADAPAAAGRGRLGQDRRRAARDAAGRRQRRAGGAAGADRGARAAAPPLAAALLGPLARPAARRARGGTRVALLTGSQGAAARRRRCRGRVRRGRHRRRHARAAVGGRRSSPTSGWSSSTSSTASASSSATRCAPRAPAPHVLVMTATPIPRTIAMTVYGDLETSTLSELPAGRQPIQTNVVPRGVPAAPAARPCRARKRGGALPAGHRPAAGTSRPPPTRRGRCHHRRLRAVSTRRLLAA